MKPLTAVPYVLSLSAAALLTACGGSQPPIGAPGAMRQSQTLAIAPHPERSGSWMLPEAKNKDLLYISDLGGVHMYSLPKEQYIGDLTGLFSAYGLCSDRNGDVFVTDLTNRSVDEFAHGSTKPLKTLYDNHVDFGPFDCAVDPTTSNVAVTSLDSGFAIVFPKAEQRPKVIYEHTRHHVSMYMCAYDNKGDLFVDQIYDNQHRWIGELPKGTKQFTNYLLDSRIAHPGGIQFDGNHVAIQDHGSLIVYRLSFSGSKAVVVGSTPLNGAGYVDQYWIQGKTLIGPDSDTTVYFWKYPEGGSPVSSIGGFLLNYGSTVSVAPSR